MGVRFNMEKEKFKCLCLVNKYGRTFFGTDVGRIAAGSKITGLYFCAFERS